MVGSRDQRTQFWKRAIQIPFHQSLAEIGPVVSEEKIKVYDVRRTDGRRMPSDGKSSRGLWPGELKRGKAYIRSGQKQYVSPRKKKGRGDINKIKTFIQKVLLSCTGHIPTVWLYCVGTKKNPKVNEMMAMRDLT